LAAPAAVSHAATTGRAARIRIAEARVAIFDIHPASGPAKTEVTLTGFGFTADNTIYFGLGVIAHVPIASSIGIACTADPNCRGGIKQMLVFTVPGETAPGEYRVRVENANGTSNEVRFTVTGGPAAAPGQQ
jgi:hypothetical protein